MKVKYHLIVRDEKILDEKYFEDICCDDMRKAMLAQEASLTDSDALLWLYCPFCKTDIEY